MRHSSNFQKFTRYKHDPNDPNSLSHDRAWSILRGRSGHLWIATFGGGLNKFDPEKGQFFHYRFDPENPNSLSNDYTMTIHEDRTGMLWMGSNGAGLIKFDPQQEAFLNYAESEGLRGSAGYGILEDSKGNLWMSTNDGLSRFNPQTETFKNYDVNDGLQGNEFNGGARYSSPKGEMFFGGINGFNSFFPDQIKDNPHLPPVVITNFKIFNKTVPIQEGNDGQSLLCRELGIEVLHAHSPQSKGRIERVFGILQDRLIMTLLKNDGILPLSKDSKILVAGPRSNDTESLSGGWTGYPQPGKKLLLGE